MFVQLHAPIIMLSLRWSILSQESAKPVIITLIKKKKKKNLGWGDSRCDDLGHTVGIGSKEVFFSPMHSNSSASPKLHHGPWVCLRWWPQSFEPVAGMFSWQRSMPTHATHLLPETLKNISLSIAPAWKHSWSRTPFTQRKPAPQQTVALRSNVMVTNQPPGFFFFFLYK